MIYTTHHQHRFDWSCLSGAGIAGGVMNSEYFGRLNNQIRQLDQSGLSSSQLPGLVSDASQSLTHGSHFNALQVVEENLGQSVVSGLSGLSQIGHAKKAVNSQYYPYSAKPASETMSYVPEGFYEQSDNEAYDLTTLATEAFNSLSSLYTKGKQALSGLIENHSDTYHLAKSAATMAYGFYRQGLELQKAYAPYVDGFLTRAGGLLEAGGGLFEMSAAFGLTVASEGALTPLSAAIGFHASDSISNGLYQFISGKERETFTTQGLMQSGMSKGYAKTIDAGLSLTGSFGTYLPGAATLLGKTASQVAEYAGKITPYRLELQPGVLSANDVGGVRVKLPGMRGAPNTNKDIIKAYHATSELAVTPILEGGFRIDIPNPQAAFHNNRFGAGVYISETPMAALVERPNSVVLKVEGVLNKHLDITSRGPIYDADLAKSIARGARKHGYDSIRTISVQKSGGINIIIFDPARVHATGVNK